MSSEASRLTGRKPSRPHWIALILTTVIGLGAGIGTGYALFPAQVPVAQEPQPQPTTVTPPPVIETPEPEPLEPVTFNIAAAGDILLHRPVHSSARSGDGYDFNPLLAQVDHLVDSAGIALCHVEVPLIPDGQAITGYPMFGSSRQIAFDLKTRGWDGCSTASNHSVDKTFTGIESTINALEEAGLGHAGTARSEAEHNEIQFYTVSVDGTDTVIAHLSVTRNLNGLPVPAGKPWSVNLIDSEAIISQARAARELGADIVVASVHDGVEYTPVPTIDQQTIATDLAASGEVDLFVGHHPHIPQPITLLEGGPDQRGMWTAYSLGNFLSNQDSDCCVAQTANGLMMFAQIVNDHENPPYVAGVSWRALTVDRLGKHTVYDLSQAHADGTGIGTLSAAEVTKRYGLVEAVVGDEAPELGEIPAFTGTVTAERRAAASTTTPEDEGDAPEDAPAE